MSSVQVSIIDAEITLPNKQKVTADVEFSVWVGAGDWAPEGDLFIAAYGIGEDGDNVHITMDTQAPLARRWVRDNSERIWSAVERELA